MPAPTPSFVTASNDGSQGDREFIFSCKGRPFAILTLPNFPTPPATLVDYNLVRDLKLRMTELQCTKMYYAGHKFRILGRFSTSVQCISEGAAAGNAHLKALVIQDLYHNLDTHGVAGQKFSEKLIGPPYKLLTEPAEPKMPTEPTKKRIKAKKRSPQRTEVSSSSDDQDIVSSGYDTPKPATRPSPPASPPRSPPPNTSPRARVQGRWIQHDWCPYRWDKPPVFVTYYEDRDSGLTQDEKPDCWDSDASVHSISSARSFHPSDNETTDEYYDEYTNISTVIQNGTDAMMIDPAQNPSVVPGMKVVRLQHSVGPPAARSHSHGLLTKRRQAWNVGVLPSDELRDVPVPHGAVYCNPDCLYDDDVPLQCGYNLVHGKTISCTDRCPGAWCKHPRGKGESVFLET